MKRTGKWIVGREIGTRLHKFQGKEIGQIVVENRVTNFQSFWTEFLQFLTTV
jgi:hypothetical protein